MNERKRLVFTAIAVSLLAVVTGLFLGGDLLPSNAESRQYDEKATTTTTKTVVTHSHDDLLLHQHLLTIVVTTTETTPHGYFHDFAMAAAPSIASPTPEPATPTPQPTTPTPEPTTPLPVRSATEVWIFSRELVPGGITVPVGTKITWVNKDTYLHNITSVDGLFNANLNPNDTFSYTFDRAGAFSYYCEPHPEITGTVIVR